MEFQSNIQRKQALNLQKSNLRFFFCTYNASLWD